MLPAVLFNNRLTELQVKKLLQMIATFVCALSMGTLHAAPITGSIDSAAGGGMFATGSWAGGNAELSWSVSESGSLWTYLYHLVVSKNISHTLFQTSDTFTEANVKDGTTSGWLLDSWGDEGNSNVGIPGNLYGIKFAGGSTDQYFTIVSDRTPMWGSWYARDGKDGGGPNSVDVFAYNVNFGSTSNASIYGTAPFGFVLVPDTTSTFQVSEPASMALLGLGFAFMGGLSRYRDKRGASA